MIKDLLEQLTADNQVRVNSPFLLKSVEQGSANQTNRPYLNITLSDKTGTLDARKWEVVPSDHQYALANHIVWIEGVLVMYHKKPQLKISTISPLDEKNINRDDYITTAPVSLEQMVKEVRELVESIQDPDIKAVAQGVLKDHWDRFISYPAAVTVHQAYEKGLIYHSLSATKIAVAVQALYPTLFHRDYIICGTLLHDIGKVEELSGPFATVYTRMGNLESHIQIGAMIVNRKCHELGIPQEKTDLLTHILLSHHGKPEYGSAVVPKTPDAFLVHFADDLDAKADVMLTALKQVKPGEFTPRIPWMDNNVMYRATFDEDYEKKN